jgi:hypothetical protein
VKSNPVLNYLDSFFQEITEEDCLNTMQKRHAQFKIKLFPRDLILIEESKRVYLQASLSESDSGDMNFEQNRNSQEK